MKDIIFEDKNDKELFAFYYSTKGVYTTTCKILLEDSLELERVLKSKYLDKEYIKNLRESIKKRNIEIETMEKLYKIAFNR